jgi:presenilin-like A22 family membrane protease
MPNKNLPYSMKGAILGFIIGILILFLFGWGICGWPILSALGDCSSFFNYTKHFFSSIGKLFPYLLCFIFAGAIIGVIIDNIKSKKKKQAHPPAP